MSSELDMFNECLRPLLFIAGIQAIASDEIRPGDYVKIHSGEEGYVSDIAWRYTTIRSLPRTDHRP
jgi:small-conductance mechanosensitive channel